MSSTNVNRIIMAIVTGVISVLPLFSSGRGLSIWEPITGVVAGLIIYEIFYRSRGWLNIIIVFIYYI